MSKSHKKYKYLDALSLTSRKQLISEPNKPLATQPEHHHLFCVRYTVYIVSHYERLLQKQPNLVVITYPMNQLSVLTWCLYCQKVKYN